MKDAAMVESTPVTMQGVDLAYARPSLGPVSFRAAYLLQLPVSLLAMASWFAILACWVLPYRTLYHDFRMRLAVPTEALLVVSDFVANYYGWLLLVAIALVIPWPAARFACSASTRRDAIMALLIGILFQMVLCLAVAIAVLFMITAPLMRLVTP